MRLMRWFGAGLGWTLGVALVAWASWVAINSAGRQVVDQTVIAQSADGQGGGSIADAVTPAASGTSPSRSPSATPSDGVPPATGEPRPSADADQPAPGDSPGTSNPPASQAPVAPPPTSRAPVTQAGTQDTPGGSVWLECTGTTISNAYAFPAAGWSGSPFRAVSGGVETHFIRSTHVIEVHATCLSGRPRFEVHSDDHDHDHDDGHDD